MPIARQMSAVHRFADVVQFLANNEGFVERCAHKLEVVPVPGAAAGVEEAYAGSCARISATK